MKLYIYKLANAEKGSWDDIDYAADCEVVAIATGETNEECEAKATDAGYTDTDLYGWTYADEIPMGDDVIEL